MLLHGPIVNRIEWAWGYLPVPQPHTTYMFRQVEDGWRLIYNGTPITVAEVLDGELIVIDGPTHQVEIRGSESGAVTRLLPAGHHSLPDVKDLHQIL